MARVADARSPSSLRRLGATMVSAAAAAAMSLSAAAGHGELLRFDLTVRYGPGVPRTYADAQEVAQRAGMTVTWAEPLARDAAYTQAGGASYGSFQITWQDTSASVTWIEFDSETAAQATERELGQGGSGDAFVWRRAGRVLLQVYADPYQRVAASEVLETLCR